MTAIIAKNIQIIDDWGRFPQLNARYSDWASTRNRAAVQQSLRKEQAESKETKPIQSHYLADMAGGSIVIE